jgi:hypothetical protein
MYIRVGVFGFFVLMIVGFLAFMGAMVVGLVALAVLVGVAIVHLVQRHRANIARSNGAPQRVPRKGQVATPSDAAKRHELLMARANAQIRQSRAIRESGQAWIAEYDRRRPDVAAAVKRRA